MTIKSIITISPRLICLVLSVCFHITTASAQSGNIRLGKRSAAVSELIGAIQSQTGFRVAYNPSALDGSAVITFTTDNPSVTEVLDAIAKNNGSLRYITDGRYIVFVADRDKGTARPDIPRRTSDVFSDIAPEDVDGRIIYQQRTRPDTTRGSIAVFEKLETGTESEQYSIYERIDKYAVLQTTLPRWSLKADLLYAGLAQTPNLGIEFGLGPKYSFDVRLSHNPWTAGKDGDGEPKQWKHWMIRSEARRWMCERFRGHYFGVNAFGAFFEVSGTRVPMLFEKKYAYEGHAFGAGLSYGYHLPLGKCWGIDFNVSIGGAYFTYDRSLQGATGGQPEPRDEFRLMPPSAGISLQFLFK